MCYYLPAAVTPAVSARTPLTGGQKRLKRKTSRVTGHGQTHPGTSEETGPIPAVGIPEKYQRECEWSESPIYSCQHCRDNGIFDPRRFNFLSASELQSGGGAPRELPGPFLSDLELRKILENLGVEIDRNPVDEAFQRGRFSRGAHPRGQGQF